MKKVLFASLMVLAMCSIASASVILDYVENPSPGPGLKSYTVRATGDGIVTLGQFTIDGNIYQEFLNPATQSPWLGDETADPLDSGKDSYICFGDLRMPDLAGSEEPSTGIPITTTETILDGSAYGLGTLNNYDGEHQHDGYLYTRTPTGETEILDLFHLVLADGDSVTVALKLYSYVDIELGSGGVVIGGTVVEHDFFNSNNLVVPEPGCVVLLIVGGLCLVGCRRRKRS